MADAFAPILRDARPRDDAFRQRLYATTRAEELAATGWPEAQRDAFLRQQFQARQNSYRANFPEAQHCIVFRGQTIIGAMIVHRTTAEIRLVDIALLPEHRRAGVGSHLVRTLMDEARTTRKPLRLQVLQGSPATQLYTRLGFTPVGANGLYLKMEWQP